MTPKYLLRIRSRSGIIADLVLSPTKPTRGRPKNTAKHAAVMMAFRLEFLRLGKRLKAQLAVAAQFGYTDERKVRGIINAKQNPLRGDKGNWLILMGVKGSGDLVIVTDHPDAVVVTETTIRIDGRGWIWKTGEAKAGYGQLRGGGMVTE